MSTPFSPAASAVGCLPHVQRTWENHPIFEEVEPRVFEHFCRFHRDNPHIFDLFMRYAHEVRKAGRTHYSAKCITERIRWHYATTTTGDEFKISNSVTSCYPRLLIIMDPSFESFFTRHQAKAAG